MYTQFYSKLISCLGTGWENKKLTLIKENKESYSIICFYNLSLITKIFWRLLKRRHMKKLKKSVNKFIDNKKFNVMIEKEIINSNLYLLTNFFSEICSREY